MCISSTSIKAVEPWREPDRCGNGPAPIILYSIAASSFANTSEIGPFPEAGRGRGDGASGKVYLPQDAAALAKAVQAAEAAFDGRGTEATLRRP